VRTRASDQLIDLAEDTAMRLEAHASEQALGWVNERDHLAKCLRASMVERLPGTGFRPARRGERKCDFPQAFPGVGDVDALLVGQAGAPVWIELKCGSDLKRTLAPCGYDLVKCALGLVCGSASEAFLLAGAPRALWAIESPGTDLFSGGAWRAQRLRSVFAEAFREYEELADPRPTRVPAAFAVKAFAERPTFSVAGVPWELRLARVCVGASPSWYDWPAFLSDEEQSVAREKRALRRASRR
jgi:hypothetical protein